MTWAFPSANRAWPAFILCLGGLPAHAAASEARCRPRLLLHGDDELTAAVRASLGAAIELVEAPAPENPCPLTEAWVSRTGFGLMLAVDGPWGTDARAVQSAELAAALLESWSAAPVSHAPETEGPSAEPVAVVLERAPASPPRVRTLAATVHGELASNVNRWQGAGAAASVGPVFAEVLRPYLLARVGHGTRASFWVEREALELELLLGLELDTRPTERVILAFGAAAGLAWLDLTRTRLDSTEGPMGRSFLDPRVEARGSIGVALDESWGLELSLGVGLTRDLWQSDLSADQGSDSGASSFVPTVRVGLGVRWSLTELATPTSTEDQIALEADRGDYARPF